MSTSPDRAEHEENDFFKLTLSIGNPQFGDGSHVEDLQVNCLGSFTFRVRRCRVCRSGFHQRPFSILPEDPLVMKPIPYKYLDLPFLSPILFMKIDSPAFSKTISGRKSS